MTWNISLSTSGLAWCHKLESYDLFKHTSLIFFRLKGTTKEERIETQNKQFILNPRIFHSFSSCVHCKDIFDNRRYGLFDNASTISILMHMFLFSWSYLRNNIIVFIWTRRVGDKRESFCCATNFVFFIL